MAADDRFTKASSPLGPFTYGEAVTPHDTTQLAVVSSAIYVGGLGDVTVLTIGGQTITFKAVPVGTILPIRAVRVNSTATTATLMVALA